MLGDLDLESYGQTLNAENADQMLCSDMDRLEDRKNSRRAAMYAQIKATEIQSSLCDKIKAEKQKIPNLEEKIADLEESDPELFKYIRGLETIRYGIWCEKCGGIKKIGGRAAEETNCKVPTAKSQDLDDLKQDIRITLGHLESAQSQYNNKMQECADMANRLKIRLMKLMNSSGGDTVSEPKSKNTARSSHFVTPFSNKRITTEQLNEELNGQSLPEAPTFDLDALIDEKLNEFSADDLLG